MKKITLTIISAVIAISAMAQSANLSLNLEKNKTYRFKSVSDQNISQSINGMEQNTTTVSNTVVSIKVMDLAAGFIVAEVKFDTISNTTNAMGKTTVMSSAQQGNISSKEPGEIMSSVMNKLSKNPVYVKMDKTGKVVEVVNLSMLQSIVLKDTAVLDAQMKPAVQPQIANMVTNDAIKMMVETFTHNLPGKEVKKGEQWEIVVPVNSGGMMLNIVTNYKLNDIKNNVALVLSDISIKAADNAQPMVYGGAKINYDGLTGMGKSDIKLNGSTGLMVESVSKMNIVGDLNLDAPGMTMKIPMKIVSQTSVKSI